METVPINPLATAHPRALEACAFLRRMMQHWLLPCVFVWRLLLFLGTLGLGSIVLLSAVVCLCGLLTLTNCRPVAKVVCGCELLLLGFPLFIAGLAGTLRLVLMTFFFARYSLLQVLAVVLAGGALVTLLVMLPGGWMPIPVAGLLGLAALMASYISAQDQEGPGFTPGFIKRALEARKPRENTEAGCPEEAAGRTLKDDPNPLATLHPRARKVCRILRAGMRVGWRGIKVGVLALLVCLVASPSMMFEDYLGSVIRSVITIVAEGACCLGGASLALFCAAYLLRLAVIALFFMRYSLGQLMGAILWWGACMTLFVRLPDEWKGLAVIALAPLLAAIWAYIIAHDPEDPWFTPELVRRMLGPKRVPEEDEEQAAPARRGDAETRGHGDAGRANDSLT